ncbi:MAG: hypothetical protein ACR2GH_05835 [Pseudonocardia sp.]
MTSTSSSVIVGGEAGVQLLRQPVSRTQAAGHDQQPSAGRRIGPKARSMRVAPRLLVATNGTTKSAHGVSGVNRAAALEKTMSTPPWRARIDGSEGKDGCCARCARTIP